MQLTRLVHEPLWISKVKAIHWPLSKVTQIQHFKTSFPKTTLGQLKPNFVLTLHGILEWKFVQMFRVTWPRWFPGSYVVKIWKKNSSSEPRSRWFWNLVYSFGYSSTVKFLQMKTLGFFMTWSNLFRDASAWVKAYTANSYIFRRLF